MALPRVHIKPFEGWRDLLLSLYWKSVSKYHPGSGVILIYHNRTTSATDTTKTLCIFAPPCVAYSKHMSSRYRDTLEWTFRLQRLASVRTTPKIAGHRDCKAKACVEQRKMLRARALVRFSCCRPAALAAAPWCAVHHIPGYSGYGYGPMQHHQVTCDKHSNA